MNKLKAARIAVQISAFVFAVISLFILSFPVRFISTKEFFLTSPSLLLYAQIAAVYFAKGMIVLALFVILALLFGRVFCGWLCPFGAVMDFFAFIVSPFKKRSESPPAKGLLSKYILLAFFGVSAILGFQFVWFFEPVTVFSRFFHLAFFPFVNAVTDKGFQYAIMNYNVGENLYYLIRDNLFSARQISFNYSLVFLVMFIVPVLMVLYKRRFWCRYICPLGASLGILSIRPAFPLKLAKCKIRCGKCENMCRANAIRRDGTYIPSECVMCMDCAALECRRPETAGVPAVEPASAEPAAEPKDKGITRKQFLFWGSGVLAAIYMIGRKAYASSRKTAASLIRPPGAMPEREFKQACVRCGNCMKVCVTNGLQPSMTESGIDGIWTPKMDNLIGYCEYNCNACGQVCPTQAIKSLPMEKKTEFRMGLAEVHQDRCIPWKDGISCIVCQEHCPIPDKAIKLESRVIKGNTVDIPVVDIELCIGCGICENKCPVEGRKRGITVQPL